jgi:putative ABC transport system permease protein
MHSFLQSLRYSVRLLLKSPGFAITAVLILGFGIGVNTAIFSLINGVLLKPLPYPKGDRLVRILIQHQNEGWGSLDYPDYLEIRAAQRSFDTFAVSHGDVLDLSSNGQAEQLHVGFVSPSVFETSGRPFILGRGFTDNEDIRGGPLVVVLSEKFWRQRFNSDPAVIGKNLSLSDQNFQIIGVCPQQLVDWGPPGMDAYVPVNVLNVFGYELWAREQHLVGCLGRLKDGVSTAQAQAELEVIQQRLALQHPETDAGYSIKVIPLLDSEIGNYSTTIWLLGAAVGCLLLISSANVANLLFARALARRREIAIRAAMGASRLRLVTQLMLETLFLSLLGAVAGLLVAFGTVQAIKALAPQDQYRFQEISVDGMAMAFVFVVILLTSFLSGLLPAWSLSNTNLGSAVKEEGGRTGTGGPRRQRTQSGLVIAQVALACVLVIGTGLLLRSYQQLQNEPRGLNSNHVLTAELSLTSTKYELDGVRTRAFFTSLLARVQEIPEVSGAALNDDLPFYRNYAYTIPFGVEGDPSLDSPQKPRVASHIISSNYFRTLQIPILQGRDFNGQDTIDNQKAVIIDQALAERFFGNKNPLGRQIRTFDAYHPGWQATIVGIVPHVRHNTADYQDASFQVYFPYTQSEQDYEVLVVRTAGDPRALIPTLRRVIASIDPTVPVARINSYEDSIDNKFLTRRLGILLITTFSLAALFLSGIGLYGVLAYFVSQRSREIGVRIALGAQRSNILGLVVSEGIKLAGIGLILGTAVAMILARFINGILYGVSGSDPIMLGMSVVVLGLVAIGACLLPALRATRINPITVLRE